MKMWSFIVVLIGALFLSATPSKADDHIKGRYLVNNYLARQYNAGTQNWDVVQDSRGVLYFANRNGVLIYDGFDWITVPNSLETPLRSIAITDNDVVYVGSVGEFGVLEADSIGNPSYRSLSSGILDVITDVWETHVTSTHVYFVTRSRIYALNRASEEVISIASPQSGFQRSGLVYGEVYVGVTGRTLYKIDGEELIELQGFEQFQGETINSLLESPNMNGSSKGMYILTNSRKTFHYGLDTGLLTRLDADNSTDFKIPAQTYRARKLRNGDYAFATIPNGVVFTDSMFTVNHIINRDRGLLVDMALNVFEGLDGAIWVTLNNGLSRIDFHNNILMWNTDSEFPGGVLSLTQVDNNLYIGTSLGLFRATSDESGRFDAISEIPGTAYQIFDMNVVQNRFGQKYLLLGGSLELSVYNGIEIRSLIQESVFVITPSKKTPGRLFLGLRNGWAILDVSMNQPGRLSILDYRKYEIPPFEFRSIEEDKDGGLWLGSRFNGVFYVPRQAYETKTDELETELIRSLTEANGLESNSDNFVHKIDENIILSTSNGIKQLSISETIQVSEYDNLGQAQLENVTDIYKSHAGEYYVLGNGDLNRITSSGVNGNYEVKNVLPFLRQEPFNAMLVTDDSEIWLGGPDALFKVKMNGFPTYKSPFHAVIHGVYLDQDSLIARNILGNTMELMIPYGQADVTFQFGSTRYIYGYTPRFESRLEGYDENWSGWSTERSRTYTNLSNGRYTFMVRSIDPFGNVSQAGTVVIVVPTPWFKSVLAYIVYLLILFGVTYAIVRFQTSRIARHNRLLEKKVIQRTAELQVEKRRLETMNDNLKALDENRDKFLSVVAHDLRNPLMIIRSSSDLIQEEIDDKSAIIEFAGYIRDASLKMQNIIENLLEDRAKKIRLHEEMPVIDIQPVVLKICKENEVWAQSKSINLNIDAQDNCFIKADTAQVGVIIDNLVSNAIKYSPQHKNIHIRLEKTKSGQVELSIIDEGPGLLPSEIQKIGKPSVKLSAKPTGGESSSGMGLFIVKDLLLLNNGEISVYSAGKDKGSTFKVIFPVAELES